MTWSEFKAAVEARGVTDEMEIDYIDIGSDNSPDRVEVDIRGSVSPEALSINPNAKMFAIT